MKGIFVISFAQLSQGRRRKPRTQSAATRHVFRDVNHQKQYACQSILPLPSSLLL